MAGHVALENSAHRRGLVRIDFEPHAFDDRPAVAVACGCALDRDTLIAEYAAAGVQSLERELLDAAESALRQVLDVELIDNSVRSDEKIRLLARCVDALGDKHDADAGELEILDDTQRV